MAWPSGGPASATAGATADAADFNNHRDALNELRAGGVAIASQAAGDLLYAVDADSLGRVAITSGQVLQGQGAAAPAGVWALETSQNGANQLDNGDDLDNVTTRGLYHWSGSTPPANDPLGGKFSSMLVTVDAGQPQQLVWSGQGGSFRMAMRRRDSGTWTSWKEAFSIANPPAFTNITGSIADGQVPASAVDQHVDPLALTTDAPSTPAADTLYADTIIKAWAAVSFSGGTPSIDADVNVASLTDNGVGDVTVTFAIAMSATTYAAVVSQVDASGNDERAWIHTKATGSVRVRVGAGTAPADKNFSVIVVGAN